MAVDDIYIQMIKQALQMADQAPIEHPRLIEAVRFETTRAELRTEPAIAVLRPHRTNRVPSIAECLRKIKEHVLRASWAIGFEHQRNAQ